MLHYAHFEYVEKYAFTVAKTVPNALYIMFCNF